MRYWLLLVAVTLLNACVSAPCSKPSKAEIVAAHYRAAQWRELPDWPGEQLQTSWQAWLVSCVRLGVRADWKTLCADAAAVSPTDTEAIRNFFEQRFSPWQIETTNGVNSGLITGYYDVLLKGSRHFKAGRVPIYGVPNDLLTLNLGEQYPELKGLRLRGRLEGHTVVPYWSRRDIDNGKAADRSSVLAWADDPLDVFFLHVQGSGRILFEDGSMLRLGYADQNGHPYRAIGKWLVEHGELPLEQVTMQSIRAWAQANPTRVSELLASDPSYIFFNVLPAASSGALGALAVPLTDAASIAVDPKFIPLGSPVYLSTTRPDNNIALHRLVQAQDTGGAIRGPVRADYFWGSSAEAAELAGKMKQRGQLWLLWPKGQPLPAAQQ